MTNIASFLKLCYRGACICPPICLSVIMWLLFIFLIQVHYITKKRVFVILAVNTLLVQTERAIYLFIVYLKRLLVVLTVKEDNE
jgi:hypothetical protein